MADNKRYYWLKLPKDFFERKEVKLLRKLENGALYVLIYQKILLNALETDGEIYFDHLTDTPEEELALSINEEVEDVRNVLKFLLDKQLVTFSEDTYLIEQFDTLVGKESNSTERVRAYRERKKQETLHETEKTLHETNETLHVTNCNTEKRREEIEKRRIDIEEEKEKDKEKDKEINKDTVIDTRVDTEVREDTNLETIRLENQQLFNDFVADKTLSKKQRVCILGMVNKYDKPITKKQIQGFYNYAMTSIND